MAGFRDLFNLTLRWWSGAAVPPVGTTTGIMRVEPRLSGHLRIEPRTSGNILVEPRMAEGIRSRVL